MRIISLARKDYHSILSNYWEALVKRAMVASARTVIVLSDSSKAGDAHLHRFAELADIDILITDTDLDDDVAGEIRAAGPDVVTA